MPKYEGYLKHICYYRIEVEVETIEDAEDLMWDQVEDVDWTNPIEIDNEIVNVEEIENA